MRPANLATGRGRECLLNWWIAFYSRSIDLQRWPRIGVAHYLLQEPFAPAEELEFVKKIWVM